MSNQAPPLTDVQHEILRRAVYLSRNLSLRSIAQLRVALANEGYEAADIQVTLRFWAEAEQRSGGLQ